MTALLNKAPKENGTIRLEYLKGSKAMMGFALWNLKFPRLPGYPTDGDPTFSLEGLKERNLIRWF